MAKKFKGKYFVGSRGYYGTNSVKYQNIEIEITKYNHDYANPVANFDWGNTKKGTTLLASAILSTIASPTVARIYSNKYTQNVLQHFKEDEWKIEAIEVVQWINNNTDYTIKLDEESEKKAQDEETKEAQKTIENEKANLSANNVVDTFCMEFNIKKETLARILDVPIDTINNWRLENEMPKLALKALEFYKAGISFKEKSSKLKIELNHFQEQLLQKQTQIELAETELNRYRKFINAIDIPTLYKKYKEL